MESTDTLLRKRIDSLEKLRNSGMGNAKYRVHFTDGTSAETATNSSIALTISNSERPKLLTPRSGAPSTVTSGLQIAPPRRSADCLVRRCTTAA